MNTAFSRDQEEKIYVQDNMYEAGFEIFQWVELGAILYVCGDAIKMAKDVELTLQKIIEEQLKYTSEQSLEYIKKLKKEKRYLLDVY